MRPLLDEMHPRVLADALGEAGLDATADRVLYLAGPARSA